MAALMALSPGAVHAAATLPWLISGVVPQAGFPSFSFPAVAINVLRSGANYQLTASYASSGTASLQLAPGQTYDLYSPSFTLSALVSSTGALVGRSNTVSISGGVSNYCGLGCDVPVQELFSAKLLNYGSDALPDATPTSVGFTTDVSTFSGWATQFSTGAPESVYLFNFPVSSFVGFITSNTSWKNSWAGSSVTTVPIPAGAWLFGSAIGVLAAARRKKASAST